MKKTIVHILFFAFITIASFEAVAAPVSKIRDIKTIDSKYGRLIHDGATFTIKGIVQTDNLTDTSAYLFSMYDSTGAIIVYLYPKISSVLGSNYNYSYTPHMGDSIELTGTVSFWTNWNSPYSNGYPDSMGTSVFNPLPGLGNDIKRINKNNKVRKPRSIITMGEQEEGDVVLIDSLIIDNQMQWYHNPTGVITARKANDTGRKFMICPFIIGSGVTKIPTGIFSLKGIVIQDDTIAPFLSNYLLMFDGGEDLTFITQSKYISNIHDLLTPAIWGGSDSTYRTVNIKGVIQTPNIFAPDENYSKGLFFSVFDKTGSIMIWSRGSDFAFVPQTGDSIFVSGKVTSYSFSDRFGNGSNTGWTCINPDSIALPSYSKNNPIPPDIIVNSFSDTVVSNSLVSKRIRINNVRWVTPNRWDTAGYIGSYNMKVPGSYFYAPLEDTSGKKFWMRINNADSLYYTKPPAGFFDISGIEANDTLVDSWNNTVSYKTYSIWPTSRFDYHPSLNIQKIHDISVNDNTGKNLFINKYVAIKGIAQSRTLSSSYTLFPIADSTGSICVYDNFYNSNYYVEKGDSIFMSGTIMQVNGLTAFKPDYLQILNSGNKISTPKIITKLGEPFESQICGLKHLTLYKPDSLQWYPRSYGPFHTTIQDTLGDTFTMVLNDRTFIMRMPGYWFDLTGVILQSDKSSPFNSGYYIEPRDSFDFAMKGISTSLANNEKEAQKIKVYPNPAKDLLNVSFSNNRSTTVKLYSSLGQLIFTNIMETNGTIDISSLHKGIYFMEFMDSKMSNAIIKQFVVE